MQDSKPLVSIVAVCYNHEKFLRETLNSIKNQTYDNIQLIIMDDCSKDQSVKTIQAWIEENAPGTKFIAHHQNEGLCKTLNEALQYCDGIYYQMIACDDILMLDKIETQVNIFSTLDESYACVYGDQIMIDKNSVEIDEPPLLAREFKDGKFPTEDIMFFLTYRNLIPAPTVLLKTGIVKKVGGYETKYQYEDWPTWIKLARNNYKFYSTNKILAKYRLLDNSMNHDRSIGFWETQLQIYSENKHIFYKHNPAFAARWKKALEKYNLHKGTKIKYVWEYANFTKNYIEFLKWILKKMKHK